MQINGNDILKSCYTWWCGNNDTSHKSYMELTKSEADELYDKMKCDIIRKLDTTYNYHSVRERHNSIVDIIRIANAMAYVNGININNYINLTLPEGIYKNDKEK